MDNVIVQANDYIYHSKIAHLPVKSGDLVELISREGYDVFSYAQAKELIQFANLESYLDADGFTYTHENFKAVLYKDELSSDERAFVLAHELGHIILKHTANGINKKTRNEYWISTQEEEADDFAYQLLAPICILKHKHIKTVNSIMQNTLLGKARSERVLGKVVSYKPVSNDKLVCDKFFAKRNNIRTATTIFVLLCMIAVLMVLGASLLQKLVNAI